MHLLMTDRDALEYRLEALEVWPTTDVLRDLASPDQGRALTASARSPEPGFGRTQRAQVAAPAPAMDQVMSEQQAQQPVHRDIRSMDHLDELEAQSVYILREAFAKLDKLAHAVVAGQGQQRHGLAGAQGVLRPRAVPGDACRHRARSSRRCTPSATATRRSGASTSSASCARRSRRPIRRCRRPPARPRARPLGLKAALAKHGFDGLIAGIRRDEEATRAKERVFSAARRGRQPGTSRTSRRSSGTSSTTELARTARTCASIRCCTGPRSTSGATPSARASRSIDLYFAKNGKRYRSLGRPGHHLPIESRRRHHRRDHRRAARRPRCPSAPAARMDHETEDAFERLRADGYM